MSDQAEPLTHKQEATDGMLSDDKSICDIIMRDKRASRDARWASKMEWDRAWNLYNGVADWSQKAEWQSKVALPRVNTAVRAGAYLLKRGLVGPRDFFATEGFGTVSKQIAPTVQKMAKHHLEQGKFVNHYVSAIMAGMLNSLVIMKVYPSTLEANDVPTEWPRSGPLAATPRISEPSVADILGTASGQTPLSRKRRRLKINYDAVSAYDFYPDPLGDDVHKIHTIDMDLHKFREIEESDPRYQKGIANLIAGESFKDAQKEVDEASRAQQLISTSTRKRVQIDEFWGDLVDGRGVILFKNCYAVMVNEKYMAVRPRPAPYLRLGIKDPFVVAPVIERPFSVWHQGFIESVAGIAETLTDLGNVILDGNKYASIKAFELDIDQVYNPADFQSGLFPGKVYMKRGSGQSNNPMIRDIQLGNFNPQVLELFQMLDREFQTGSGLNEFLTPQMRSRAGRVTATEAMSKRQDSADFFGEIAHIQEEKMVEPCIDLTYKYAVAYQHDFTDPMLVELIGSDAAAKAQILLQDPDMRNFLLTSPLKFTARGMSGIAQKARELEKVMAFINLIGNVGKVVPGIFASVNIMGLVKKAIEGFNWDETEIMNMGGPVPPTDPSAGGTPGAPPVSVPQPSNGAAGVGGLL